MPDFLADGLGAAGFELDRNRRVDLHQHRFGMSCAAPIEDNDALLRKAPELAVASAGPPDLSP